MTRIGFIAMSGVRAESAELLAVGLTMPGVVERSKVVASLPSLSLLTLAGMTPPDFEVEYHEIQDISGLPSLPDTFDLVAISSLTAQIDEAYAVADAYRRRGTTVVMGGLHVRALPEEALEHCDAVAIGEGEKLWPLILQDFRCGCLQRKYVQTPGDYFDLADAPMPRFDLLSPGKYNRFTVQTSRGCPHSCEFCASSILLTPKYQVKPVEKVIAEIRCIKSIHENPFIEFADDNSFAVRGHYKELLRELKKEHVKWFTEADISIADDPELLDLMREAGCRQVLIGLESPTEAGLNGIEIRRNWKLKRQPTYLGAVNAIQSRGITVNGCFILGLDGQTPAIFDEVHRFTDMAALYDVQITVMTAFPGTPLYDRLEREGRITQPRGWRKCTLFDVNYRPTHMTARDLELGMMDLARRLYEPAFVEDRRRRFLKLMRSDEN